MCSSCWSIYKKIIAWYKWTIWIIEPNETLHNIYDLWKIRSFYSLVFEWTYVIWVPLSERISSSYISYASEVVWDYLEYVDRKNNFLFNLNLILFQMTISNSFKAIEKPIFLVISPASCFHKIKQYQLNLFSDFDKKYFSPWIILWTLYALQPILKINE